MWENAQRKDLSPLEDFSILKRIVGDVGCSERKWAPGRRAISVSSSGSWVMWASDVVSMFSSAFYFSILKRIVGDVGRCYPPPKSSHSRISVSSSGSWVMWVFVCSMSDLFHEDFSILKRIVGDVGTFASRYHYALRGFQYPQADRG